MSDLIIRFIVGGTAVCIFSVISDLFKPKTFAGLFGAAPSVALASLSLTVFKRGHVTGAIESRSMLIGAVSFLIYATFVSYVILRFRARAMPVAISALLLWLASALGLWYLTLA